LFGAGKGRRTNNSSFYSTKNLTNSIYYDMYDVSPSVRDANYYVIVRNLEMGYGLKGRGLISGRDKAFCFLDSVQTDCRAHQAYYPMGTGREGRGGEGQNSGVII
jgi:hypothetical protein